LTVIEANCVLEGFGSSGWICAVSTIILNTSHKQLDGLPVIEFQNPM
jgi:hypothetical protein